MPAGAHPLIHVGFLAFFVVALVVGVRLVHLWWRTRQLPELLIGLGVLAFVRVDTERISADATRKLEDAIRALPEVVACHYISGTGTFELQVVAQDLDGFSRFTRHSLMNLPNVKDLHTSFSLGEVKASHALPLGVKRP